MATTMLGAHAMGLAAHEGKGNAAMQCVSSPDCCVGYTSSGAGPSGPFVEHSPSPECPSGRHTSSSSPTSTCAEPGPAAWAKVKRERLSPGAEALDVSESGSSGDPVTVAKFKHKLVEQSRREKTRALTSELQAMVPALADFDKGTSINVVLEGVLQFLKDNRSKDEQKGSGGAMSAEVAQQQNDITSLVRNTIKSVPRGVSQKAFAFSPVGMVCSSTSGQLLWFNPTFARMFSQVVVDTPSRPSMFSLTAPESLPDTMQAATSLLLGHRDRVAMSKRCVQRDGKATNFQVEMTCVRKNNAPAYFCCYVRTMEQPRKEVLDMACGLEHHPNTSVCKLQEILTDSDIPDELDGLFNFEED